ncbi:hypothetical protein AB0D45_19590 [Streptomyces sp. NPDC048352]|uniref:hypothetical protein n=1 Tax=Streptomyces sp. NPDC048352 TaxID=3154718 RepID=UPI00342684D0
MAKKDRNQEKRGTQKAPQKTPQKRGTQEQPAPGASPKGKHRQDAGTGREAGGLTAV